MLSKIAFWLNRISRRRARHMLTDASPDRTLVQKFKIITSRKQAAVAISAPDSYEAIWQYDAEVDSIIGWLLRQSWLSLYSRHAKGLLASAVFVLFFCGYTVVSFSNIYFSGAQRRDGQDVTLTLEASEKRININVKELGARKPSSEAGQYYLYSNNVALVIPVFVASIALLQFLYNLISKRRATASLVCGEIVSIARIYAAANIIGEFVNVYSVMEETGTITPSGFGDVARKENYYTIFDKNIESLGSFDRKLVNDIASFYTFLKAARDATGAIELWGKDFPIEQSKADVVNIIYLCFLQLMHGHFAVELIIEKANKKYARWSGDIFVGIEMQCFCFLMLTLKDKNDFRYHAVKARLTRYQELSRKFGYDEMFSVIF